MSGFSAPHSGSKALLAPGPPISCNVSNTTWRVRAGVAWASAMETSSGRRAPADFQAPASRIASSRSGSEASNIMPMFSRPDSGLTLRTRAASFRAARARVAVGLLKPRRSTWSNRRCNSLGDPARPMSSIQGVLPSDGMGLSPSNWPSTWPAFSGSMALRPNSNCFSWPSSFHSPDLIAAIHG